MNNPTLKQSGNGLNVSFGNKLRSMGTALVGLAGATIGTAPKNAEAAITLISQQQQALDKGRQMALNDQVRQLQFNIVGGSVSTVHGTSTPLGPMYSGMSRHYFDYVTSVSGSSNFSITIGTGGSRDERLQTIPIANYIIHPTLDFVLLEHSFPVANAMLPVFGTIGSGQIATFAGYGDRYVFGSTSYVNDGRPAGYNMTVAGTSNASNYVLTYQFAPAPSGGPTKFDSSSPGYNQSGQLTFFMDNGLYDPMGGFASGGAIPFVNSGLADFIIANTPLNYIPEPSTALSLLLGAGLALVRRRR